MPMIRPRRVRFSQRRVPRLTGVSLNRMIPNMLTLLAMCAGLTAIRFGFNGKFESAVIAILVAGVLDGLDGRVARLLKSTSPLGAQLDSLSDSICFGVAPAIVLYLWALDSLGSFGWAVAVFFAMCCALRLARFNTQLDVELPPYAKSFFTGVPAPGGAGVALAPMYVAFAAGDTVFRSPFVSAIWMTAVAALMVSRIPTFSMKRFHVPHHYFVPIMLAVAVAAAFLTTAPWPTLAALSLIYVATIPLTMWSHKRMRAAYEAETAQERLAVVEPLSSSRESAAGR